MASIVDRFLESLCDRLKRAFGQELRSVVLFGSQARGTASPDSDIDILLIFENLPESNLERYSRVGPVINSVCEKFGRPLVSNLFLTVKELKDHPRVLLDMVEDSRTLFDDGTFKNELDVLRKRMAELGSKRVFLDDDTWYWVLKPGMKLGESVNL